MAKKEAIEKHSSAAVEVHESSLSAPDYLRPTPGEQPAGTENIDRSDMTLPRLGLCQNNSPQRIRTDAKYIEGLREGDFFNSITGEVYGERLQIVPLLFYKSRILFGEEMGGPLRCQATDGLHGIGTPGGECTTCPLSQFGVDGTKPECHKLFNYAALVVAKDGRVHPEGMLVFSLKSSGLKVAMDWNALIKLRRADIFAGVYEISSVHQKNDKGQWYAPVVKNAGWVSKDTHQSAQIAYAAVAELNRQGRLKHDVSDLAGDGQEVTE